MRTEMANVRELNLFENLPNETLVVIRQDLDTYAEGLHERLRELYPLPVVGGQGPLTNR